MNDVNKFVVSCLDVGYSTTRLVTKEPPVVSKKPEDEFETVLLVPEGKGRQGEGGLRLQGYFKTSEPDKPLITVVTVVFDGEQFLEETIKSVINQTYDNIEYIIIDGGSTDGTLDIICKYEQTIDYWVSENDRGIYDAMNKGIDAATGSYLLFLGADDELFDSNVFDELKLYFMEKPDLVYGDIKYRNQQRIDSRFSIYTLLHNTIHHQGAFYHSRLFTSFRYNTFYSIAADYELNLKIYLDNKYKVIKSKGIISLCRDDGISHVESSKSHAEMNGVRKKYMSGWLNHICKLMLGLKVFLKDIFKS
ncbi:MAG: glycosyltransferase [Methylococcaceae bacterium]|nr:glycosyltransferase [Methylococcaceae bacterium]